MTSGNGQASQATRKTMRLPGSVAEIEGSPPGPEVGAFFDLDGTLVAGFTGVVMTQDRLRRRQMSVGEFIGMVQAGLNHQLGRSEFEDLIDLLCEEFDHVVFDVPPLLSNASSLAIVRLADSSLLVTKQRHTSISHVRRALGAMESTRNLGVILNQYRTYIPSGIRRLLGE